jgi:hypothetical protein
MGLHRTINEGLSGRGMCIIGLNYINTSQLQVKRGLLGELMAREYVSGIEIFVTVSCRLFNGASRNKQQRAFWRPRQTTEKSDLTRSLEIDVVDRINLRLDRFIEEHFVIGSSLISRGVNTDIVDIVSNHSGRCCWNGCIIGLSGWCLIVLQCSLGLVDLPLF